MPIGRTLIVACWALFSVACGGSAPKPTEPLAYGPPPEATAAAVSATATKVATAPPPTPKAPLSVNDKEHPVPRCGPKDSYFYVATEFKCGDGSNPLQGNLGAGHDARVGNVGANSTGHIIDLYEIPCPEGPKRVFVDMYGCPGTTPGGAKI